MEETQTCSGRGNCGRAWSGAVSDGHKRHQTFQLHGVKSCLHDLTSSRGQQVEQPDVLALRTAPRISALPICLP